MTKRTLLALGLTCASALTMPACARCASLDVPALFAGSDVVFRGSVERIYHPSDGRPTMVMFQVAQSWKGQPPMVHFPDPGLEQGAEYLVFANGTSFHDSLLPRAVQPIACARDAVASLDALMLADLAAAEARWKAGKPESYEFTVEVSCFCGMQRPPPRFRVVGARSEALQPFDDERVQQLYEPYDTVEKMFAALRRAIQGGADGVEIRYDPTLGYPIFADLDFSMMTADEERRLRVIDLRPVR